MDCGALFLLVLKPVSLIRAENDCRKKIEVNNRAVQQLGLVVRTMLNGDPGHRHEGRLLEFLARWQSPPFPFRP